MTRKYGRIKREWVELPLPYDWRIRSCFFFVYSLVTRMRPIRSWRDYVQSVSCPLSAQRRHVASAPLPSAQACPKKI